MFSCIGIDLGTSNSRAAVWRDGRVDVMLNEQGNRSTPSVVAFSDEEQWVGEGAVYQAGIDPNNSLFMLTRLIGREYTDPLVQEDCKYRPMEIIRACGGGMMIATFNEYKRIELRPHQLLAMVLKKMKQTAEVSLGQNIYDVVITVPTCFNSSQRQAIKEAGTLAGLNVKRILSESSAAALAYGVRVKGDGERTLLVFDLGGGTLSVALLTQQDSVLRVRAVSGDNNLGGEDIDKLLVDRCVDDFNKQNQGKDIASSYQALHRLRKEVQAAKRLLSGTNRAYLRVNSLYEGIDYHTTITRAEFESICRSMLQRCIPCVEKVLSDAGVKKESVDRILLTGGSTRIPMVQQLITNLFGTNKLCKGIDTEEAVVQGAALQGALLGTVKHKLLENVRLLDVTPFSLKVKVDSGPDLQIVPRNFSVPVSILFSVELRDAQRSYCLKFFQDGNQVKEEAHSLEKRQGDKQRNVIEIEVGIDADGLLGATTRPKVGAPHHYHLLVTGSDQDNKLTAKHFRETADRSRANIAMASVDDHRLPEGGFQQPRPTGDEPLPSSNHSFHKAAFFDVIVSAGRHLMGKLQSKIKNLIFGPPQTVAETDFAI